MPPHPTTVAINLLSSSLHVVDATKPLLLLFPQHQELQSAHPRMSDVTLFVPHQWQHLETVVLNPPNNSLCAVDAIKPRLLSNLLLLLNLHAALNLLCNAPQLVFAEQPVLALGEWDTTEWKDSLNL